MQGDIHPNKYKNLFMMVGPVTCLNSEFLLKGALKKGDPLVIYKEGEWHTFINQKKENICLKQGLKIFQSKTKYLRYSNSFRKYLAMVKEDIIPKYRVVPAFISKKEFVVLLQKIAKLWHYYGITEFPYTDLAYVEMEKTENKILRENLYDLGNLKIEGRNVLNEFIHIHGVIPNILEYISSTFLYGSTDAYYLFSNELKMLFNKKKLSKELIEKRKKCYAVISSDGKLSEFSHNDSLALAKQFIEVAPSKEVKGIIGHKGKVVGKVVIAPMFVEKEKINAVILKMKEGDILVAQSTTPEYMGLVKKAAAIVTDQGGMLSHAAIISRELKIPCVIGTKIATKAFKDGDLVEVDANKGIVKKIK